MTAVAEPLPPLAARRHARPGGRRRPSAGWLYLAPAGIFLGAFFLAPLLVMLWQSLHEKAGRGGALAPGLTLANYAQVAGHESLRGAMLNSLELTALTLLLALPLAYAMAASIVFAVPRRWHAAVLCLAVLPFWTSYVVRTYAWLIVLGDKGVVNGALLQLGLLAEPLSLVNNRAGVLIVFAHYFLMVMTLAIYVSLSRIPPNLLRAAEDLGAPPWAVFLRVVLPLSLPGVATGAFLTVVLAVGDYVTPQIVGGGSELTMPQAIMLQMGRLADGPLAAALSLVLTLVVVASIAAFSPWLRTRAR